MVGIVSYVVVRRHEVLCFRGINQGKKVVT